MVSKHSQEDESEEPDFGDSDSDVSAQQVRHAEVVSWPQNDQIADMASTVTGQACEERQRSFETGGMVFWLKRSLETLGFVHRCTFRSLFVWECS